MKKNKVAIIDRCSMENNAIQAYFPNMGNKKKS